MGADLANVAGWVWGLLTIFIVMLFGGLFAAWWHKKPIVAWVIAIGLIGTILTSIGIVAGVGVLFNTPANVAPAPSSAAINVLQATSPALPSGCTLYQNTYTVQCTLLYNKTSNYFAIAASGSNTFHKPVYLVLPFNLIRTDPANQTYSFASSVTSIPTANSLGSNPTLGSIIGFTPATSTQNGQWQVYPDQGTLASQKPTVNAPTVSTNVETTGVPIQAFSSKTIGWHITLAGSNSTSASESFASALTNYTAYPMTFTFANAQGGQATWTLDWTIIAWVS